MTKYYKTNIPTEIINCCYGTRQSGKTYYENNKIRKLKEDKKIEKLDLEFDKVEEMLKIKDNVDLKELEKFGLKLHYIVNEDTGETYIDTIYKLRDEDSLNYSIRFNRIEYKTKIMKRTKIFYILKYIDNIHINILYDLIQADIIEKVEK